MGTPLRCEVTDKVRGRVSKGRQVPVGCQTNARRAAEGRRGSDSQRRLCEVISAEDWRRGT